MATVRRRLHQPVFRRRVLTAYRSACALCNLRHENLLDAAHIKEDSEGGQPIVPNGVAMCAIHHRAFDGNVIGIRPDYVIEVRRDVLDEIDGPTLQFALQGVHGNNLRIPKPIAARPDVGLLEERYERFRSAS
jgi:putative restriction endonuclease